MCLRVTACDQVLHSFLRVLLQKLVLLMHVFQMASLNLTLDWCGNSATLQIVAIMLKRESLHAVTYMLFKDSMYSHVQIE